MKLPTLVQIVNTHKRSIDRYGGEYGIMQKDQLDSFEDSMRMALFLGKKDTIGMAA